MSSEEEHTACESVGLSALEFASRGTPLVVGPKQRHQRRKRVRLRLKREKSFVVRDRIEKDNLSWLNFLISKRLI